MKRIASIVLRVLGGMVAVVALLIGATMLLLETGWGAERLRRQVVARVNQQIQGHLDVGHLSFGGNRLNLQGVTLRDPEGQIVADITRIDVGFSVASLVRKEVRVTAVVIEAPHLDLVSDARGLNLTRATAPRKPPAPPTPPRPKTSKEGWVMRLDRFDLIRGDVALTVVTATARATKAHLADLQSSIRARYATGNGSLDLTFALDGRSVVAPVGPLRVTANAVVRGSAYRFGVDGDLLNGTMRARGNLDTAHLDAADALIAVAIPSQELAGNAWGPLLIDGQAHPGSPPRLDLSLAIPGVTLTGKSADGDQFSFDGRLALEDLGLTARAAAALTGGEPAALAGQGQIAFGLGGPMAGAPASWSAHVKGLIERLRSGETAINDLVIEARTEHLSSRPGEANLDVAVASLASGTTQLRAVTLDAKARAQDLSLELHIAEPQAVSLIATGRLDEDREGLAIERLALTYPGAGWTTAEIARLRFGGDRLSLANLRLVSEGQSLAVNGSKTDAQVEAELSIDGLRLDLLPTALIDPDLRLGGALDVHVKADGALDHPHVAAQVRLQHGRYQGFTRLGAQVKGTLTDHQIDGTVDVEAPFAAVNAGFKLPDEPLAAGAPLDLRLEVTRLNLGEALRGAAVAAPADGRVTASLRVNGSADSPKVDLVVNGKDLQISPPAPAKPAAPTPTTAPTATATATAAATPPVAQKTTEPIDVGQARLHLTYADRAAHADIDFAAAHGGSLRVDAAARVDLSYPRVTRGLVVAKLPVRGKVVARGFDVAWIAAFSERLESMGGQVDADAKLAGTVGDPQFVGDVRWKNGKVVATVAKPPAPARR